LSLAAALVEMLPGVTQCMPLANSALLITASLLGREQTTTAAVALLLQAW
jgi:hypothetical protein